MKRTQLCICIFLLILLCIPCKITAQCTLLPPEQFTTSANFSTGTATTTQFWSPSICTTGGLLYYNSGGCAGGYIGKTGSWNNYFGCFLRTPQLNCTGNSNVTLNFDISNSYFSNHPNDKVRFYMWVDNGFKNASQVKIGGVSVGYSDINGLWLKFNQARSCVNVDVVFDLTTCSDLTNILFYIEPNCGYNDGNVFSVVLDNISIKGQLPLANAGVDDTICGGASAQLNASGGTSYTWSPAAGLSSTTIANPVASPSVNTTYTVTATGTCGTATDDVIIIVDPAPATPVITQIGNTLYSNVPNGNQWYDLTGPIGGATGSAYSPANTGYYFVIVADSNGCLSDTSNSIYVVVTGFQSCFSADDQFGIYPNPAKDKITIRMKTEVKNTIISVFDMHGRMVFEEPLQDEQHTMDISVLAKGAYVVRIKNDNQILFQRFIRE